MKVQLQQVLKREIINRHLTVNSLAKSCRIPSSVLHSWIHGVLPSAKNLHHVAVLAKYLNIPVSVLLFDLDDRTPDTTVLFNSEFRDGEHKYRLLVEKVRKG